MYITKSKSSFIIYNIVKSMVHRLVEITELNVGVLWEQLVIESCLHFTLIEPHDRRKGWPNKKLGLHIKEGAT